MKKVLTVLLCLFVFCLPLFAANKNLIKKEVEKDAKSRNFIFVAFNKNYFNYYYLYKDSKENFYLYDGNSMLDNIFVYGGCKVVSKETISKNMKRSSESKKIIEGKYTVYEVDMGFWENIYYYVKTPNGNFYSVSDEIKEIKVNGAEDLINDL